MKLIAITNQKGGVGKTTTSINLAAGLGRKGHKVLLVDLDPQSNATNGIGVSKEDVQYSLFDILFNNISPKDAILTSTSKNVDLLPSSIDLAGVEISLTKTGKSVIDFKTIILQSEKKYDIVIFDCPPSLGLINKNALSSSDFALIPVQAEYFALEGLSSLLSTVSIVKKKLNPKLKILGILLTMYNPQVNLSREVESELLKFFREKVFNAKIPRNISLAESPSAGLSIFDYNIKSKGAQAYLDLSEEVEKGIKNNVR